jgi:hypothetical protein
VNEAFRAYAFGRAFRLDLSERHTDTLASLCRGDMVASYGVGTAGAMGGLLRRGLVETYVTERDPHLRYRATKAGLLVYDLLVEAGEHAALEEKRRKTLEMEAELHRAEWDERFGNIEVRLKDRYRRAAPTATEAG